MTDQLQHVASADHVGLSTGLIVSLILAIWSARWGRLQPRPCDPHRVPDSLRNVTSTHVDAPSPVQSPQSSDSGRLRRLCRRYRGLFAAVPAALVAIVVIPPLIVASQSRSRACIVFPSDIGWVFVRYFRALRTTACGLAVVVVDWHLSQVLRPVHGRLRHLGRRGDRPDRHVSRGLRRPFGRSSQRHDRRRRRVRATT